ncbi:MAG: hypothetical protein PWQ10_224 [Patescibacteria group bacterium]|nr:hypothetical protein [Patescibacteria group bacterium]
MEENKKPKLRKRINQWMHKNRKILFIIGGILLVCIAGIVTFLILSKKTTPTPEITPTRAVEKTVEVVKYYSPLTGVLVANETATKLPVTGIMIENSPDARPQSGIKNSGIVFEAIAEGGITRFLVLYQQEKPQLIGPVRSVRSYYIDWAAAFNASIAHVGGSSTALAEVRNGNYRDIDQFFNSSTYWRATDRYAPHNVYTSFEKIDALNTAKGYTSSTFTGFTHTDGQASEIASATSININMSSALYNSHYIYDKTTNTYARSQAGEPHMDREAGQITPSVVIAMNVEESTITDDGHQNIITIGSGKAVIFQNGTAINATWSKKSKTDQITFTDESGKNIPLVRGQTWISAIPTKSGSVTWE